MTTDKRNFILTSKGYWKMNINDDLFLDFIQWSETIYLKGMSGSGGSGVLKMILWPVYLHAANPFFEACWDGNLCISKTRHVKGISAWLLNIKKICWAARVSSIHICRGLETSLAIKKTILYIYIYGIYIYVKKNREIYLCLETHVFLLYLLVEIWWTCQHISSKDSANLG